MVVVVVVEGGGKIGKGKGRKVRGGGVRGGAFPVLPVCCPIVSWCVKCAAVLGSERAGHGGINWVYT